MVGEGERQSIVLGKKQEAEDVRRKREGVRREENNAAWKPSGVARSPTVLQAKS